MRQIRDTRGFADEIRSPTRLCHEEYAHTLPDIDNRFGPEGGFCGDLRVYALKLLQD